MGLGFFLADPWMIGILIGKYTSPSHGSYWDMVKKNILLFLSLFSLVLLATKNKVWWVHEILYQIRLKMSGKCPTNIENIANMVILTLVERNKNAPKNKSSIKWAVFKKPCYIKLSGRWTVNTNPLNALS